jgi:hypothetical protein
MSASLTPLTPLNPPSGSTPTPTPTTEIISVTSAVVGTEYTIVSLGDTTPAQWVLIGAAATPTTGSIFTAKAVGVGTGTISYIKPAVDYTLLAAAYEQSLLDAAAGEFNPQEYFDDFEDEEESPIEEGDNFEYNDEEIIKEEELEEERKRGLSIDSNNFLNSSYNGINYNTLRTEISTYNSGKNELIRIFTTQPNFLDISSNPSLANLISDFLPKFISLAKESRVIIKDISDDYKKTIQKRDEDLVAYPGSEDSYSPLFVGADGTPINPQIIAPSGSRYDIDGDGTLNEEEKKELEYDIKKEKLVNLLTSSLDTNLFIPKYNLTCQQLLDFKDLPLSSQSKEIKKYLENNSQVVGDNLSTTVTTVSNISQSISQSIAAVQLTIKAGKQFWETLTTARRKSVKGKVIDLSTNKPVKGALVKYYPKDNEIYDYHQDYTNFQGKFKIFIDPILSNPPIQPIPAFQTETTNPILVNISGEIDNNSITGTPQKSPDPKDPIFQADIGNLKGYIVYVSENELGEPSKIYSSYKTNVEPRLVEYQEVDETTKKTITTFYYSPVYNIDIPQDSKFLSCKKDNRVSTIDLSKAVANIGFTTFTNADGTVTQEPNQPTYNFYDFIVMQEETLVQTKPSGIIVSYPIPLKYEDSKSIIPYDSNGNLKRKLGIILLKKFPKPDTTFFREQEDQINEENLKQATINFKDLKYYALEKLAKLYKTLKKEVLPAVLILLLAFGISKGLQAISDNKKEKKKKCPNQANLLSLIKKKNNLVKILNNTYITLDKTTQYITAGQKILDVINASLLIVQNIPIPTSTGVPGTPGIPVNVITKISENIDKTKKIIADLKGVNKGIITVLLPIKSILKSIITLLNLLDSFVKECAEESGVELEQMEIINAQLLSLSLQTSPSPTNEINGFILTTETESTTNSLKRTRAIAKNNQGIILLTGEYSLTSIKQILIDELVFYIKINDLKAY